MMKQNDYMNIPKEKFEFVGRGEKIFDRKLETKPIGYFKDAFIRFRKNKSSVVAAIIILILILYAIIAPIFSPFTVDSRDPYYATVLPKNQLLAQYGIWDGTTQKQEAIGGYHLALALGQESGIPVIIGDVEAVDNGQGGFLYRYKADTYAAVGYAYLDVSLEEFERIQAWQDETGTLVCYPIPESEKTNYLIANGGAGFWYKLKNERQNSTGEAKLDKDGNLIPNYKLSSTPDSRYTSTVRYAGDGDNGQYYLYGKKVQGDNVRIRVLYSAYYEYVNGHEASFLFGTNAYGQDIYTCLAAGARLSFILALSVSAINLTIGAIYGAIEGYYGGTTDIVMERISDILASVPFMVVVTLFKLHLAEKVGALPSLLFAFVLTGWVGMAARVRMQFYRFKGQEYILAARTLGAKDGRLMFKHIFPNSIGTIITGSVLVIPGVIFSESSLSYLGIINLETSSLTSVGTLLSQGQGYLSTYPHIIFFPALFIALLEISFNLFGNGLRDAFNPSLRGVEE